MYLAARAWGIQPLEFWEMTPGEYMVEAVHHALQTPEGRAAAKRDQWLADMALTDEEWKAKYHGGARR